MTDPTDFEISDSRQGSDNRWERYHRESTDTFNTVATVLISGEPRLILRQPKRSSPHLCIFHSKGILPIQSSIYKDRADMEEEPTQKSTQPLHNRRRVGVHSLTDEDEANIICILQPINPLAFDVANVVARATPQHILGYDDDDNLNLDDDLEYETLEGREAKQAQIPIQPPFAPQVTSDSHPIALRLTSNIKDPCMGFVFGRDPNKCDIMLDLPAEKNRVSGMHFRIFLNDEGIIMLEDTSTNGTIVDGVLLRYKDPKTRGTRQMRMIQQGSEIEVFLGPFDQSIKFNVITPVRDRVAMIYHANLLRYIEYIKEANRNALAAKQPPRPRLPLPLIPVTQKQQSLPETEARTPGPFQGSATTMLTAGSTAYKLGAHWNGGEKYNLIDHIGRGAFADVYKYATKAEGKLFAVKEIEKRKFIKNGILDHKVNNELQIMKDLSHPHIIQYVDHEEKPEYLFIVMEYIHHGDLSKYLNAYGPMAEFQCKSVTRQICHALKYLHNCRVTHRDIKPDNILISSREPFEVKLSDFGLSKVINDADTFLKTFCGTLLYCAPEVYPEYDQYRRGLPQRKRNRLGETSVTGITYPVRDRLTADRTPRASPYSSAVDIWSFAAVIFHLLCDKSPYKGSSENRGALMLKTIMETPLNTSPLRQIGVSQLGIMFLEQMLQLDPRERPSAAACLHHPWIRGVEDVALIATDDDIPPEGLANIEEEVNGGDALDASQLSLNDNHGDSEGESSVSEVDEIDKMRESKRVRTDQHYDQSRQGLYSLEALGSSALQLPITEQINAMQVTPNPPNRLFGEIGVSGLRSSGVLSQEAYAALQISSPESHADEASFDQDKASEIGSDVIHHHNINYPKAIAAPYYNHPLGSAVSLFGAEEQIGQLNMTSPESGISAPATPRTPKTPKSRRSSLASNLLTAGTKRTSEVLQPTNKETASKRSKLITSRQTSPDVSAFWDDEDDNEDRSTHSLDHGYARSTQSCPPESETQLEVSHMGSLQEERPIPNKFMAKRGSLQISHRDRPKEGILSMHRRAGVTRPSRLKHQDFLPTEPTKRAGKMAGNKPVTLNKSNVEVTARKASSTSGVNTLGNVSLNADSATNETALSVSPTQMGKLVSVEGSSFPLTLNLEERITSWGRDPASNTHVYHDAMDVRVPKAALDIIFWRSGIEAELKHGAEFTKMPDIQALIQTRCSKAILVNGVPLTKEQGDGWLYGILKTGDIITIFDGPQGFLKLRCEFYVGLSQQGRVPGEKFIVEKEVHKFMAWKSAQTSPATSAIGALHSNT